jgi:hypothetical protein
MMNDDINCDEDSNSETEDEDSRDILKASVYETT